MPWRLPAEWEPQWSLWLVWPRDPLTWPDGRIEGARAAFVEALRAVAPQHVDLVVHPDLHDEVRGRVRTALDSDAGRIRLWPVEHQDSWIRDYGPLTQVDDRGGRRTLKFRFDAWGGKYPSLMEDDHVVDRLRTAGALADPVEEVEFVLEGGAVETDGQGTFLATASVCEGRDQEPAGFEQVLRDHLGARQVVWLPEGVAGDDTDGHIDTLARFVAPGTVVAAVAPEGHPDHAALAADRRILARAEDAQGRRLRVLELPVPEPMATGKGDPLPAGHANFLITNAAVLVPAYGGPSDLVTRDLLARAFPDRQVMLLDHRDLIWGFGGIHCLSMQVPA